MTADDVVDHKSCDLGCWYFSPEGQAMADQPGFAETGRHHEDMHHLAREIVTLVNQGDQGRAIELMHAFDDAQAGLFGELDTLYCA